MEFLKEWVRGLVMLVLLATCLELVLPMNNMKKYVRMAMSLLVVLAVTKPIMALLGQSVSVDSSLFSPSDTKSIPSIAEIMRQAEEFQAKNQTLAAREAGARLAEEARLAAESVDGVASAKVQVDLEAVSSDTAEVGEVTVKVTKGDRSGGIQPIEPVRITASGETAVYRAPTDSEADLVDAVRKQVADRLGVKADPSLVRILIKGQPDNRGGSER